MKKIRPIELKNMRHCIKISNDGYEANAIYDRIRQSRHSTWADSLMQEAFVVAVPRTTHCKGVYYVVFHRFSGARTCYFVVAGTNLEIIPAPSGMWITFDNAQTSHYVNPDSTIATLNSEITALLLESTLQSHHERALFRYNLSDAVS